LENKIKETDEALANINDALAEQESSSIKNSTPEIKIPEIL